VLAGEHPAGASEAGDDFIGDHQHVVLLGQLAHAAQVAGRLHDHAGGALHERFDDHRRDLVLPRREHGFELS
jgi:hypothetical protein